VAEEIVYELTMDQIMDIRSFLLEGKEVEAIDMFREYTGCGEDVATEIIRDHFDSIEF
jgi:hypothetical protein